ncbi:uncharacterized protein LOC135483347 [Lineus longissimus]|uniref:uncharacterized protein LOC135483347 n=1 Tax=Lineus longissimus TaxID=88925 RepID=UPI00315D513A
MKVKVNNISSGEKLVYSLPLLIGEVEASATQDDQIQVWNETDHTTRKLSWPICSSKFKVLVELTPGKNVIKFLYQDTEIDFILYYAKPVRKCFVRPVYIKCKDDTGRFQAPEGVDNSPTAAKKRIILGAQLIQTFTAEKMHEHGLGRTTFQLETDKNNQPVCHVFTTSLTLAEAHSMSGGDLWTHFAREFMTSDMPQRDFCKWYAFMSFTRYTVPLGFIPKTHGEILHHTKGHTALGGGGLALFGTGNLHTWAESLADVVPAFTDCRKMDKSKFMDDSAYRQYYWANYATGLGASLHELGHTFDLGHTTTGIMARGFDDLHRVFTVQPATQGKPINGQTIHKGPYSPQHIPAHRRVQNRIRHHSAPNNVDIIHVECAFHRLLPETKQTVIINNYDGTKTKKTFITYPDGSEDVIVEDLGPSELLKKLKIRPPPLKKIMQPVEPRSEPASAHSSPIRVRPAHLPSSSSSTPPRSPIVKFADGGAHWHRASALLLRWHRWFNEFENIPKGDPPIVSKGQVTSPNGLRQIEVRNLPDGIVFHHWEFLDEAPKLFRLPAAQIKDLSGDALMITIQMEDNLGLVVKKKLAMSDIVDNEASEGEK